MHINELSDLTGQVALVTGGYGIYGFPISKALAAQGQVVGIGIGDGGHRAQRMQIEGPGPRGSGLAAADDADAVLRFGRRGHSGLLGGGLSHRQTAGIAPISCCSLRGKLVRMPSTPQSIRRCISVGSSA